MAIFPISSKAHPGEINPFVFRTDGFSLSLLLLFFPHTGVISRKEGR